MIYYSVRGTWYYLLTTILNILG